MNNIKPTNVLLPMHNDTRTAHIASTSDHNDVACVEFDKISYLPLLKVILDGVVHFDGGIGVTNCAAVMGDNVGNALGTDGNSANLEKLVGSFLRSDAVNGEAAFDVVKETEMLARLLDRNYIYMAYCLVSFQYPTESSFAYP
jgi:hypothetical protein